MAAIPYICRRIFRRLPLPPFVILAASLVLAGCVRDGSQVKPVDPSPKDGGTTDAAVVTPVSGPSWLEHLGTSDHMGRLGGEQSPVVSGEEPALTLPEESTGGMRGMGGMMRRIYPRIRSSREELTALMNESFTLSGSDLYRLDCQSCHGPRGEGMPPDINSLIGPVQSTSIDFVTARMQKIGRRISQAMAQELTASADSVLRGRLLHGGKKMPPFAHLHGQEVEALIGYLQELAGVAPAGQREILVTESVARVGEHLVKGTCHICHNATGPGGGRMAMMSGIIPSLASMPQEQSLQNVVRQVEGGSSAMMSMMGGPAMPPFAYITEDEAAAAYLYLMAYPPSAD